MCRSFRCSSVLLESGGGPVKKFELYCLSHGDEVYWTDPDEESSCSRHYTIRSISIYGDIVCITDVDGSDLECFAEELS